MKVNIDIWGELELYDGIMNSYDRLNGYLNDDKGEHYAVIRKPDGSRYAAKTGEYINCKEKSKYSEIYEYRERHFRYNYTDAIVEWVYYDEEKLERLDSIGLRKDNWDNIEERQCYLDEWISKIDEAFKWLM